MGGLFAKFRGSRSGSRKGKGDNSASEKKSSKKQSGKAKKAVNLPESQSARRTVDPRLPFSNYRQVFSIRNAWKAVARTMEDCAKENLIRLLHAHPDYRDRYPIVKDVVDDEEMRKNEDFETVAMDIYQVFDDVITNLEEVDKALRDIQNGGPMINLTKTMFKNMEGPFIETIRFTLGPERFPEVTENNFTLLFQYISDEMAKYLDDDPPPSATSTTPAAPEVTDVDADVKDATDNVVADTDVEVNLCVSNDDV